MDNYYKNTDIVLGKSELGTSLPSYCCFVITLRCFMKCRMCHIWESKEDYTNELTIEEWKAAVSSLKGLLDTTHDIILSGGEPLLKKGILDLVHFISTEGYKVSLESNAYIIDEELSKKIGDSGLWRICISLDSLNEETHDFLRGKKGAYARVMEAIENMNKFCPSVGINIQTIIMERNLDEIIELASWVDQDERLDYVYFQTVVRPFGSPAGHAWFKDDRYNTLWPKDINRVKFVIDELIRSKDVNPKIANTVSQLEAYVAYFKDPVGFTRDVNCTIGSRDININPYGDAYLCFSKRPVGNVKIDGLEKIWHSKKATEVREEIKSCKDHCHFLLNCSFEQKDCLRH